MNVNRRKANLRQDQLRRRLHATGGNHVCAQQWRNLIDYDREPRPLAPLGQYSDLIRSNLRIGKPHYDTDASCRSWAKRMLAEIRVHEHRVIAGELYV